MAASLLRARQRLVFVLLTLARVTVGLFDIAVAAAMYWLFQLLQRRPSAHHLAWTPSTVPQAALLASILVILRAATDMASSRAAFGWIQRLHADLLLRLTHGYSELQWTRFVARNRGELLHHSTWTVREAADFYHRCIELIAGSVVVAAMVTALVAESATAAVACGVVIAALYGIHRLVVREAVQQAACNREVALKGLQKILSDLLSAAKEIRTYRVQSVFGRRIRQEAEAYAAHHGRATLLPQFSRLAADQGVVLLFLGVVGAVAVRHGDTRQMLSLLAFYFVLSRRLLPLVSQLSLITGQMESSWQNVRTIDEEFRECCLFRAPAVRAQLPCPGFVLEMHQVSFSYQPGRPLLHEIDFRLCPGEIAVVHGPSGMGKTTLLNLIAGVLPPVSGSLRVDRRSIACVPQEVFLLDDSIRNNLLFGLEARSDQDLMRALAAANLAGFVAAQPFGLDTQIGDNGALLSGGQRQRLGLARAILRGATLLLLDEATAALDPENEREILANLSACRAAILLVTHQQRVHGFAHRVYWLAGGVLTEEEPLHARAPLLPRDPIAAAT